MSEIMINPVIAVPIYGVCSEGYIKHRGYPVFDKQGRLIPGKKGWTGLVADPDGSADLTLFCAFLPKVVTRGDIVPLGVTFAENMGQAAAVFCSYPPVYPKIEHFRAHLMRVVSDSALRADIFFPPWVMRRMLGRGNSG